MGRGLLPAGFRFALNQAAGHEPTTPRTADLCFRVASLPRAKNQVAALACRLLPSSMANGVIISALSTPMAIGLASTREVPDRRAGLRPDAEPAARATFAGISGNNKGWRRGVTH